MSSGQPVVGLSLATEAPATKGRDVFIPLDGTVSKLKNLINASNSRFFFFRAPVASGKSTLAKYMTSDKYKDVFVNVKIGFSEDEWNANFVEASGETSLQPFQVRKAILSIGRKGLAIVIDEAHLLFGTSRWDMLTKGLDQEDQWLVPKFVLFSASGSTAITSVTPPQIKRKYLWYPPVPKGEDLLEDLKKASNPISLTSESVAFFFSLCGGHRGIFMMAMQWVQECQSKDDLATKKEWGIDDTVAHVRRSFEESRREKVNGPEQAWEVGIAKHFSESRAVRVNGPYSNLSNIPRAFANVMFGGPQLMSAFDQKHEELTKAGFIFPQRENGNDNDEFVPLDWSRTRQLYGISNPFLAKFYTDVLPPQMKCKRKIVPELIQPSCAADLLAKVVPYLTFDTVVDNPLPRKGGGLQGSLSTHTLPYEDHYNGAMAKTLSDVLNYYITTPLNPTTGKADVVVTYSFEPDMYCAIESIMIWRDVRTHKEHIKRFLDPEKTTYKDAHLKAFVIIGSNKTLIKQRVDAMAEEFQGRKGLPEIIGLLVSIDHTSYEMLLPGNRSMYFACDLVAKTIESDEFGRWIPAQVCEFDEPEVKRQKSEGANA